MANDNKDVHVSRGRSARRRTAVALWLGFALLAPPAPLSAGPQEAEVERILEEAQTSEMSWRDHEKARLLYESVLLPDRLPLLTIEQLGMAMAGRARCAQEEGHIHLATQVWEEIVADPRLADEIRTWAQRNLDVLRAAQADAAGDVAQRALQEARARDRLRAGDLYERARNALDKLAYDEALKWALEARALDPSNERVVALLDEIHASRPEGSLMLRNLMDFVQTRALAERQALELRLDELDREGRAALGRADFTAADHAFRDAIHRVDGSGFLEIGVARAYASLLERRTRFATWLQQVHDKAKGAEHAPFPPIPPLPPPDERTAGIEGQMYGLLAKLFTSPTRDDEALRFHVFAPSAPRKAGTRPSLTALVPGCNVRLESSGLSRAAWAEQWIVREIGGGWLGPMDLDFNERDKRARARGETPRILARFGDTLAVQHQEAIQRRIEGLVASFDAEAPAMRIDAVLLAATTAGVVRVSEALALRAEPGATGCTLVYRDGLLGEAVGRIAELAGIRVLGEVGLDLTGHSATRLHIEQRTAEHPMFADVPPPALSVPAPDAAYGLSLDLYAEDMPFVPGGLPRSAASIVAQTRMPTHSTILPRLESGEDRFQRIPRMGRHDVEAHLEIPYFGTFVLLGLPNPFHPSNGEFHELIVLLGARRADDPIPDAPPERRDPRVVAEDALQGEHLLGRLGRTTEDQIVSEAWPELGPADLASAQEARAARDRYLVRHIARMAGLVPDAPAWAPSATSAIAAHIHDGRIVATIPPHEHARLGQAAARLRAHETDLYRIDLHAFVLDASAAAGFAESPELVRAAPGAYRVPAAVANAWRKRLHDAKLESGRWEQFATTSAAPTQQVAIRRIEERSFVRDVEIDEEGGRRFRRAIFDRLSQGLVVEVRPDLEDESGVRGVAVRARAARVDAIRMEPHPSDPEGPIRIEVPTWLPTADGAALSERSTTDLVGDDDAVLLLLPEPGAPKRTIAIWVRVAKDRAAGE